MLEGEKLLTEHTCCLCLSDEESTFSSNTVMKSLPLHEMVNYCIGIQLTDAHSHYKILNLSAICNECVLNVNNFYAFKQKVLSAQKALAECAECADADTPNDDKHENDMFETRNSDMHTEFDEITDDTLIQMEMDAMRDDVENTDSDDQKMRIVIHSDGDDEVEFLNCEILHEPGASDEIYKITESTVQDTEKNKQIAAVADKRRNPSNRKRKRVEISSPADKVAVQVNECLICPAVLSDILDLNEHTTAHTAINCKVCHRSFGRYSNLKRHFAIAHSKPKPFVCDLCGLGFSFSVNLQTHASLHYSGKIQIKK